MTRKTVKSQRNGIYINHKYKLLKEIINKILHTNRWNSRAKINYLSAVSIETLNSTPIEKLEHAIIFHH